ILFVTFLRRVMVSDPDLKFPESVAASEIHKAGQKGSAGAKHLFQAMGIGASVYALGFLGLFAASKDFIIKMGTIGSSFVKLGAAKLAPKLGTGGTVSVAGPGIFPAYIGVGYIIGPRLAALNFAGGVLAWGLFVPLLIFFLGPQLVTAFYGAGATMAQVGWVDLVDHTWKFIVRPIAVGGMLVGAGYTLFRMRKNLGAGIKRSIGDMKKSAGQAEITIRTEKDLNFKLVLLSMLFTVGVMVVLYHIFAQNWGTAILAAVVMAVAGFFFAAVSGNLVGTIGSSNNPISGLTLSTLIIAALLMVLVGARGTGGVLAVLGVAAVICVSSAVAGEMLQDLKVGHFLGGTPWKMEVGDILGIVFSALVLYFPLMLLHGAFTFGSKALPAPQAGLMAALSQGIVRGEMAWPLVIVGMFMGFALILVQVKSPMLVAVGMYLPLETTFAIFCGGMIKGIMDKVMAKRQLNDAQKARSENVGILLASGLIAGEALMGLVRAAWTFLYMQNFIHTPIPSIFAHPRYLLGFIVLLILGAYLIYFPLRHAGAADEPPPPSAVF
ncbi:MAG: oligopeptide transporter, OPT family, partial [Candidatus Aminicenantes bacterium]|nr:oligopeptide transporter, OPT family [Candidatus Aminicenantes bacterium]